MKYLSLIIMVLITSCKSQKSIEVIDTDKAVISLSKGRCLGKCPVYDLWIFSDGNVVYNGIENVNKKGIHKAKISTKQLNEIETLLLKSDENEIGEVDGRDLPRTMLKFNDKRIVYQSSKIIGNLLITNNLIEKIKNDNF